MQTFATPAPITAVVTVPAGRIQITAADRDTATVEIRPADPAKGRDVKLAAQTTAEYSDGTLRVTAPAGHRVLGSSGAVEVTVQPGEGDESQVDRVEHQLDAHEHHDRVAPQQHTGSANGEQQCREVEVILRIHDAPF